MAITNTAPTKPTKLPNGKTKSQTILEMFGKKTDHLVARKIEIGTNLSNAVKRGMEHVTDTLTGTKHADDFNRRLQRVAELIELYKTNVQLEGAVKAAKEQVAKLDYFKKHGAKNWENGIVFGQDDVDISKDYATLSEIAATLMQARTKADERQQELETAFHTQAEILDSAARQLDSGALPSETRTKLEKQLADARNAFLACDPKTLGGKLPKDVSDPIFLIPGQVEKEIADAKRQSGALRDEHAKLTETFVSTELPPDARLKIQALLDKADLAIRGYDYKAAKDTLTAIGKAVSENALGTPNDRTAQGKQVEQAIERLEKSFVDLRKAFMQSEKEGDTRVEVMQSGAFWIDVTLQNAKTLAKEGKTLPLDLLKMLQTAQEECARLTHELNAVKPLKGLDKTSQLYKDLQKKHEAIEGRCKELSKKASEAYAKLAFGEPDPQDKTATDLRAKCAGPIQDEIENLRIQCEHAIANAKTVQDFDPEYNRIDSKLDKIADQLATKTPPLGCTKDQVLARIEIERFRSEISRLDVASADLVQNNSAALKTDKGALIVEFLDGPGQKRKAGEALIEKAGGTWQSMPPDAVKKLATLNTEIEALTGRIDKAKPKGGKSVEEYQKVCKAFVDGYTKRIDALLKENDRSKDTKKGLAIYAEALKTDMAVLAAPAAPGASADLSLLESAYTALVSFEKRVIALENMKTDKTEKSTGQISFKMSEDKLIPDIKDRLKHSLFAARSDDPELLKQKAIFAKYQGDKLYKSDPEKAKNELTQVQTELKTLKETFEKDKKAADKKAEELQGLWDQLMLTFTKDKQLVAAPAATAALIADLKREYERLATAQKIDEARAKDLIARYTSLTTAKASALKDIEKKATESKAACDKVTFELEQLRDVDIVLLKERAEELHGEDKQALLSQLKDMQTAITSTLKQLAKDRNDVSADSMLKAIRSRLNKMAAQPMGNRKVHRNQLGKCNTRWKQSVQAVKDDLAKQVTSVEKYLKEASLKQPKQVDDTQIPAIKAALEKTGGKVLALLQPDAFDTAIKQIEEAGPSQEQALGAREDALRTVRRLRRVLTGHPTVRAFGDAPFQPQPAFAQAMSALFVMESNLLTSDV